MPVEDFIFPRTPSVGNITAANRADFTGTYGGQAPSDWQLGRAAQGYPERMPGQWTLRMEKRGDGGGFGRTEIVEWPNYQGCVDRHGPGQQRWFGWSLWWPTNVPAVTGSGVYQVLWQLHGGKLPNGDSPSYSPTTVFEAKGGRLEVNHRWTGGSGPAWVVWDPMPRGVWMDFLLFVFFTRTSTTGSKQLLTRRAQPGQVPAWEKTLNFNGKTMYDDTVPFQQEGMYSRTWTQTLTLYRGPKRYRSARSVIEADLWGGGTPAPTGPGPVTNLQATAGDTQVALSWQLPGGSIDEVVVRRATGAYPATPTSGTAVGSGIGTSRTDTGLPNGTPQFYRVWVRAGTLYSDPVSITATPSGSPGPQPGTCTSSPPVVAGANLSGTITWAAAVTPPAGATVTDVRFIIDSVEQFVELTAPYSRAFDTTPLSDGAHLFNVEATFSNSTTAEDSFTAFTDNGAPSTAPLAPTSVTAALSGTVRIDWSVGLPSDTNRTGLEVAAFPRNPGADLWTHPDAIELASDPAGTGPSTVPGQSGDLAPGTYWVRAWATGPGGASPGLSASTQVTIGGVAPTDGQSFLTRRFLAAVGSVPSSPWLVQAVNQGASGRVEVAANSELSITTQSANGSASRAVVELQEDLSFDFAGGTDNVRILHLDFTVPSGASEVDLYLIRASDAGTVDPVGSVTDWVRVLLNMRGATKNVTLAKKVAGVITTLATVDLGTAQLADTDAFLQIALDQTNVRGAYLFNGTAAAMGAAVAHGLGIDLANLRALVVPFQTATTPSTFLVRYLKLMRRVPAQPSSALVSLLKATDQPWVSGLDSYDSLDRVELTGTFPSPDPGQPDLYRGRLGAQTQTVEPGDFEMNPLVFTAPAPSASPYTALLDAGNEAII